MLALGLPTCVKVEELLLKYTWKDVGALYEDHDAVHRSVVFIEAQFEPLTGEERFGASGGYGVGVGVDVAVAVGVGVGVVVGVGVGVSVAVGADVGVSVGVGGGVGPESRYGL